MRRILFTFSVCLLLAGATNAQPLDEKILEGFSFRSIGPAGMSGRITAIDVVLKDPDHIYAGSASGGVWESKNGGTDWRPIFDDQPALSIGAIRINQQNPSEIYVGTGEGNPRNTQNSGKGLFKTLDGGRTWKSCGLEATKTIHRILIDPLQPSTVYAGAMGSAWGANPERGVYKSTDSGKTWKLILHSNDRSGLGDMVMDPGNPGKIIAALYDYARTPWDFVSGGEGSGLYITYDGGDNWKKLTSEEGMPKGNLGRIGLAIAPAQPNIVYALIEAKENGLYKSTDGGEHWSLVSTKNIGNRPFYYSEMYVDPVNENRIWNLFSTVTKSDDGGKTFSNAFNYGEGVHPDHHAFWIDPQDPNYMIDGNDGGLNISRDGGRNWYFCANIPVGQFYHINVDNEYPYNVYGGMQDNGSWTGPAYVLKSGGIRNYDWRELYFGDGFDVLPRMSDTRYGWAMSQGGNMSYYDRETGFNQYIKPVHPDGIPLRFNWNAALAGVPGTDCGIYFGSQFVHKSLDCGKSWTIISPDLTTNDTTKQKQDKSGGLTTDDTNAENNTTIISIAPSQLDPKVIWVGTDDGYLQLTRDGGNTWNNLTAALPGCPKGAWFGQIEVSPFNAGEAFVAVNNYRQNDWKPYLYHTTDYGVTWKNLANEKQITSFVQCITQDLIAPNLLFLGADDGLYVSVDKGASWVRFPSKVFPHVSTMDMKIHPVEQTLNIATFGRALYVMDNLPALRTIAIHQDVLKKPFTFFPAADATQASYRSVDGIRFAASAEFRGENRRGGVHIPVYVKPEEKKPASPEPITKNDKEKKKTKEPAPVVQSTPQDSVKKQDDMKDKDILRIAVLDEKRDTIRKMSQKLKEGWSDVAWDMRKKGVRYPSRNEPPKDADDPAGAYADPGNYLVVGTYNKQKDSVSVRVRLDPRLNITPGDIEGRNEMVNTFSQDVELAQKSFGALQDVKKDMKMIETMITNAPDSLQKTIRDKHKEISKKLSALENKYLEPEDTKGYTNPRNVNTYLSDSDSYLYSTLGRPGSNAMEMMRQTRTEVDKATEEVNDFIQNTWKPYQDYIHGLNWPLFKPIDKFERQ